MLKLSSILLQCIDQLRQYVCFYLNLFCGPRSVDVQQLVHILNYMHVQYYRAIQSKGMTKFEIMYNVNAFKPGTLKNLNAQLLFQSYLDIFFLLTS